MKFVGISIIAIISGILIGYLWRLEFHAEIIGGIVTFTIFNFLFNYTSEKK